MDYIMAGDWIKIEENMPDKPEVWQMAHRLGIDPDAVAGKLIRVWAWASRNCHADGVTNVTAMSAIDRVANVTGFADAMANAGWLVVDADTLSFPKFDRHASKSAKERCLASERKRRERDSVTDMSRQDRDNSVTREEKRREENINNTLRLDAPHAAKEETKQAEQKPKKERKRNPLLDALATIGGAKVEEVTSASWGQAAKALSDIKEVAPNLTVEEIYRRAANYRTYYKDGALTSTAIAKHWADCANPKGGTTPDFLQPPKPRTMTKEEIAEQYARDKAKNDAEYAACERLAREREQELAELDANFKLDENE